MKCTRIATLIAVSLILVLSGSGCTTLSTAATVTGKGVVKVGKGTVKAGKVVGKGTVKAGKATGRGIKRVVD